MIINDEIVKCDYTNLIFYSVPYYNVTEHSMDEDSAPEPDSFVIVQDSEPKSFVIVAASQDNPNNDSDTSFEDVAQEPGAAVIESLSENSDDNDQVMNDNNDDSCNDNIRNVLDDVENQIDMLKEAVMKIVQDKASVTSLLESIGHNLPDTPELSTVEREELSLEVERLKSRLEDLKCEVVTRRSDSQVEAKNKVDEELLKLVKLVEQVKRDF